MIIRALNVNDAEALRDIRLRALRTEADGLTANLDEESVRTIDDWRAAATETAERVVFGAFDNAKIVAINSAEKWCGETGTAYWRGLYVLREYRGQKLANRMTATLADWCATHGYTCARVTVKADNPRSIAAVEHAGARRIGEELMRFVDGKKRKVYWYKKTL